MLLMVTAVSLAVLGNFGAELTARLTRPFFSLVRNLEFFGSLERIEALVVTLWVFPDFLLVSALLYTAQHILRLCFDLDPSRPRGICRNAPTERPHCAVKSLP